MHSGIISRMSSMYTCRDMEQIEQPCTRVHMRVHVYRLLGTDSYNNSSVSKYMVINSTTASDYSSIKVPPYIPLLQKVWIVVSFWLIIIIISLWLAGECLNVQPLLRHLYTSIDSYTSSVVLFPDAIPPQVTERV